MAKVHPNGSHSRSRISSSSPSAVAGGGGDVEEAAVVLTVWKKSLLFNCSGFTVFDSKGNLVYRVDNYAAGSKKEILLMDASGLPLLTLRRKKLSLGENWVVYAGESAGRKYNPPVFSARKQVSLVNSKCLAHITAAAGAASFEVEGSYGQRRCVVYDQQQRRVAAEIKRKEAPVGGVDFGVDVFRLVVQPGVDPAFGMAVVILLDQMFPSNTSAAKTLRRRFSF
uniref:Protein LURP-one-related 8 n=1 Tax=Kalanchoe fedtschenkoi TaxID=63787 RepID=A0A7N0V5A2_KALFE